MDLTDLTVSLQTFVLMAVTLVREVDKLTGLGDLTRNMATTIMSICDKKIRIIAMYSFVPAHILTSQLALVVRESRTRTDPNFLT